MSRRSRASIAKRLFGRLRTDLDEATRTFKNALAQLEADLVTADPATPGIIAAIQWAAEVDDKRVSQGIPSALAAYPEVARLIRLIVRGQGLK